MATENRTERESGVEFVYEDDLVAARDIETGVAASGETRVEALARLAEALELHEGGGRPVVDEDAILREIGFDPEEVRKARKENDERPEFLS